jgi:hypothetical protein
LDTEEKWSAVHNLPIPLAAGASWWLAALGDGSGQFYWESSDIPLAMPGEPDEHWIEGFPRNPEDETCAFSSLISDLEFYSSPCSLTQGLRAWCESKAGWA